MYKGIVLDKMQEKAFLSIAANEGLICEKGMSDGLYKAFINFIPSYQLAEEIFKQFVIAGAVYIDPYTYKYLDGELIEKKVIMPYENGNKTLDFSYFDVVSVQKMLKEKNYDNEKRIIETYNELVEKSIQCLKMEEKYGFNYKELMIRNFLFRNNFIEPYNNVKEAEYYLELYSEITKNVIFKTIIEYTEILNIAFNNDLLCPVINTGVKTPDSLVFSDNAVKILKYTSDRLGRIYVGSTIKDNLNIIQSDEAVAYRNKVNEWIAALSKQDFSDMEIIENEIIKVQKIMKHKKWVEVTGKISATVGVVASLLAHNPSLTTMCIIAEIVTYVGAPTAFYDPLKKEQYLWTSFGIINT